MKNTHFAHSLLASITWLAITSSAQATPPRLLNDPIDVSADFKELANTYFLADKLSDYDPATQSGSLLYQRHMLTTQRAFDNTQTNLVPMAGNEFPPNEYAANPTFPFSLDFVSSRVIRIRASTRLQSEHEGSLMLSGPLPRDNSWKCNQISLGYRYSNDFGSITVTTNPFHLEIRDPEGNLLTKTSNLRDGGDISTHMPFSFVRKSSDSSREFCATFTSPPGEKIFGCGESFTGLDKHGQKLVLYASDAGGVQTPAMYKPIPFFISSAGYGMFVHTTAPITCDFGYSFAELNTLMSGDDEMDLFIFLGSPKEILDEYTKLTGKSPMPPLWSFGLWMGSYTDHSEDETRDTAVKLRENKIPADVIHLDTDWFENDWRCDYQFAKTRFPDPQKMILDLKNNGFHLSLWQLPYFVPKNSLYHEIITKGLAVKDAKGNLPTEDAILDFSNPVTIGWYQAKLAGLLKMGVGAINLDFGEAAPVNGYYASGRTGFYEHNYYPLRYNKAAAEVTKKINNESIIWARSAWTGSQRYPIHWGGDAESTNTGMAAELRGGLSLGLSGFTFWSHDIGGFTGDETPDLYLRWMAFGMLTSHSRCHGMKPKEPWTYDRQFMDRFRQIDEMRYKLIPYIYAQSKQSADSGLPMLRALFVEYPQDPGSWKIDDEYLFGSSMLVAPLLSEYATGRDVYLPPGSWIDYQTGTSYQGGWHRIEAGRIPIILLVKDGTIIPHIALTQSTMQMDWSKLELGVYAKNAQTATGLVCLPSDNTLVPLSMAQQNGKFALTHDPLAGKVTWSIRPGDWKN
jgi:alpha-D-xyloside xylohydrolase